MKDKKLEERLERLEELSNKVMAPYIENVSLAQQREKIKEELEEMINASRYAKRRDVLHAFYQSVCSCRFTKSGLKTRRIARLRIIL